MRAKTSAHAILSTIKTQIWERWLSGERHILKGVKGFDTWCQSNIFSDLFGFCSYTCHFPKKLCVPCLWEAHWNFVFQFELIHWTDICAINFARTRIFFCWCIKVNMIAILALDSVPFPVRKYYGSCYTKQYFLIFIPKICILLLHWFFSTLSSYIPNQCKQSLLLYDDLYLIKLLTKIGYFELSSPSWIHLPPSFLPHWIHHMCRFLTW